MKKNIHIITIIFLLIINIVVLMLFINVRKGNDTNVFSMDRETLKQSVITLIERNGSIINYNQRIVCENIDTVELQEVIENKTLVLFFNESSCLPCINETIDLIQRKANEYQITSIAILAQVKSFNELLIFKKTNDISLNVYQMIDADSNFSNLHVPLLFTLDKNLVMNNVMSIFPGYIDITDLYINRLFSSGIIY